MHAVLFSPLQFLCILLLEEMFVQVQALQQGVPGPRSQPVSEGLGLITSELCRMVFLFELFMVNSYFL